MKLYVVGQVNQEDNFWELTGIFDTEEKALENCKDWTYFLGPMETNQSFHDTEEWPDLYYPHVRKDDNGE